VSSAIEAPSSRDAALAKHRQISFSPLKLA
jgi:hypothetical protein